MSDMYPDRSLDADYASWLEIDKGQNVTWNLNKVRLRSLCCDNSNGDSGEIYEPNFEK